MKTVWVDFNDISEQGVVSSLQEFASERLERGDLVYISDSDGMSCWAAVIWVVGEQAWLICDMESLKSYP